MYDLWTFTISSEMKNCGREQKNLELQRVKYNRNRDGRPEDVRSRPFKVTFPLGPTGKPDPLKVTVKLTPMVEQVANHT